MNTAGGSTRWAEEHAMARTYVQDILAKRRPPNDTVLDALGLERVVSYVEKKLNGKSKK